MRKQCLTVPALLIVAIMMAACAGNQVDDAPLPPPAPRAVVPTAPVPVPVPVPVPQS